MKVEESPESIRETLPTYRPDASGGTGRFFGESVLSGAEGLIKEMPYQACALILKTLLGF